MPVCEWLCIIGAQQNKARTKHKLQAGVASNLQVTSTSPKINYSHYGSYSYLQCFPLLWINILPTTCGFEISPNFSDLFPVPMKAIHLRFYHETMYVSTDSDSFMICAQTSTLSIFRPSTLRLNVSFGSHKFLLVFLLESTASGVSTASSSDRILVLNASHHDSDRRSRSRSFRHGAWSRIAVLEKYHWRCWTCRKQQVRSISTLYSVSDLPVSFSAPYRTFGCRRLRSRCLAVYTVIQHSGLSARQDRRLDKLVTWVDSA